MASNLLRTGKSNIQSIEKILDEAIEAGWRVKANDGTDEQQDDRIRRNSTNPFF